MLVLCPFSLPKNYDSLTNFYVALRSLKNSNGLSEEHTDKKIIFWLYNLC